MNIVTHRLAKSTTPTPRVLKRIVWASFLLAGLLAAGTLGFLRFGGPDTDAFDAFYMTAITITTVGYSEVVDLSQTDAGRLFAAFVSFAGFGLVTFIFSSLTVFFLETDLNEALRRRRMENAIRKLRNHYIVCGFGRVGRNVATELQATNHHFVAIDENFDTIEQHTERFPALLYLHGDASDDDVLDRADIGDAKGIFAVTGDDSRNLMICLTAKQINPGIRVVARCHELRNTEKMRKAGADVVVSPDFTGGMRIASAMIRPVVVSFLDEMLRSEHKLRFEEVAVPPDFAPRALGDIGLRNPHYVLLGVRRGKETVFNPDGAFRLEAGQTLIAMASPGGRVELEAALRPTD